MGRIIYMGNSWWHIKKLLRHRMYVPQALELRPFLYPIHIFPIECYVDEYLNAVLFLRKMRQLRTKVDSKGIYELETPWFFTCLKKIT